MPHRARGRIPKVVVIGLLLAGGVLYLGTGVEPVRVTGGPGGERAGPGTGPPPAAAVAPPATPLKQTPAAEAAPPATPLEQTLAASMAGHVTPEDRRLLEAWVREGGTEAGYAAVRAVIDKNCAVCHNADEMPRLPLTTYAEVAAYLRVEPEPALSTPLQLSLEDSMAEYIEAADRDRVVAWIRAGAAAADFATVQPVLEENCVVCHNADDMPELPLSTYAEVAAWCETDEPTPGRVLVTGSLLHPSVRLLDTEGESVVRSGRPVSTMRTCGQCHDTRYIAHHSYHASVGLSDYAPPGQVEGGRPWDTSPGLYGRWDPLTYRLLSPPGDERFDVGTADWIRFFSARHVGGGPAAVSRTGRPLTELDTGGTVDPETHAVGEQTGHPEPWDWQTSGIVEMNCFLCHIPNPDNPARLAELRAGRFAWAATATLAGTGLVERTPAGWQWRRDAFAPNGAVRMAMLRIREPQSANCGLCHGTVDPGDGPLALDYSTHHWRTDTTGQVFSPQRVSESQLNLVAKSTLDRAWDVHAERLLECANCHYSLNNPAYKVARAGAEHLAFDARRSEIGEYLRQPSHQFAKGQSSHGAVAPNLEDTMRRCESCHHAEQTHAWLPYKQRHLNAMSCEACHIPRIYAPARQQTDWTVLGVDDQPRVRYRGVYGAVDEPGAVVMGYEPVLLPRRTVDGTERLMPHNLITSWYWVSGDPPRPVRLRDLRTAYVQDGAHHPQVVAALDADGDGVLQADELVLDTPAKERAIQERLLQVGLADPRIEGEVQPFSLHHNVATGVWVTRRCGECHGAASRTTRPFPLADYGPGNVMPRLVGDANVRMTGRVRRTIAGELLYEPDMAETGLYVLGHDRWRPGDRLGSMIVLGVVLGVATHAAIRLRAVWRMRLHRPRRTRVGS